MTANALLSPYRLGHLILRNRVAMAPMTREACPGGIPGKDVADYYARRAAGGTGLIITEGIAPCLEGRFGANVPSLDSMEAIAGRSKVTAKVHAEGSAILAQLWHVGAFEPSLMSATCNKWRRSSQTS